MATTTISPKRAPKKTPGLSKRRSPAVPPEAPAESTALYRFSASTFVTEEVDGRVNEMVKRDDRTRSYVLRLLLDYALANMPKGWRP